MFTLYIFFSFSYSHRLQLLTHSHDFITDLPLLAVLPEIIASRKLPLRLCNIITNSSLCSLQNQLHSTIFILPSSFRVYQLFSLCCSRSSPAVSYFSWFITSSRQRTIHLCSSSIPLHHDVAQRSRRTGREQRASRRRDSGRAYQRYYTDRSGCGIYLKDYLVPKGSPLSPPSFPPCSPSSLPPLFSSLSSLFPPLALFLPRTYYVLDQSSRIKLPS